MNKRVLIVIAAAIVILVGGMGLMTIFAGMKPVEPAEVPVKRIYNVLVTDVKYTDTEGSVTSQGRITASNSTMLIAEASGKIERTGVKLREGSSFRKGEKLLQIYDDEFKLSLKASKSTFLTSMAQLLPDLKVDYSENYNTFYKFFKSIDLNKDLPAFPEDQLNSSEQLRTFLASKNILGSYYNIKKSELQLKRYAVYAPFDGSYSVVNTEVGSFASIGTQVAKMVRTDALEVVVPVENRYANWIKEGQEVDIDIKGEHHTGTVVRVSNFIDITTQSRSIYVKVNDCDDMLEGEFASVEFKGHELEQVMTIPRNALFNSDEIFKVVDGVLVKAQINIVKLTDKDAIINNIDEGSVIVIEPLIGVAEGTPVKVYR